MRSLQVCWKRLRAISRNHHTVLSDRVNHALNERGLPLPVMVRLLDKPHRAVVIEHLPAGALELRLFESSFESLNGLRRDVDAR